MSTKTTLLKRQKADWGKWANYWKLLRECARPSKQDIATIGKLVNEHIKKKLRPLIVILGATPEFRDLCAGYSLQYGAHVICVELLESMYGGMGQLTTIKNKKEGVVYENWLDTKLPNGVADIVMGDLTEGNIDTEFRDNYFHEMHRILKKGGLYISRTTIYHNQKQDKPLLDKESIKKHIEKYRKDILNGEISLHVAVAYFGAELIWHSYYKLPDKKLQFSIFKKELSEIREGYRNDALMKEFFIRMDQFWNPIAEKYFTYYAESETLDRYKKYFKDIHCCYSYDYPVAHLTPVMAMTAK